MTLYLTFFLIKKERCKLKMSIIDEKLKKQQKIKKEYILLDISFFIIFNVIYIIY